MAKGETNEATTATMATMEFTKQHDDDLSTTLIFGGLLATVTSAFIIFVQPQLEQDPEQEAAGLICALACEANSTACGDNVPVIAPWTGPPGRIVATQFLLYFSLVATFASVMFTILVKQLMNIRRLTRVLDGQQGPEPGSPGIHIAVFLISLLMQFALLFLAAGAIVYLWGVYTPIAITILVITIFIIPVIVTYLVLALSKFPLTEFRRRT